MQTESRLPSIDPAATFALQTGHSTIE